MEAYLKRPKLIRSDGREINNIANKINPAERTLNKSRQPHVIPMPHDAIPIAMAARMLETAIMA